MTPDRARLPDVIEKVRYSGLEWAPDGSGIFYNSYKTQEGKTDGTETTGNKNQLLMFHRMGEDQANDILVVEFPDPLWMSHGIASDDGKYLIMSIRRGSERTNRIWYHHLDTHNITNIPHV